MKLKFYTTKENNTNSKEGSGDKPSSIHKVYTLKESINNEVTKDAHYKFIKVKNAPKL